MCEKMIKNPYRRVWACVNLDALHDNLRQIAACRKNDAGIIAVIKADGYGHGAVMLAREMDEIPEVIGYAVATEEEAVLLADAGIKKPVMVLGYTFPEAYEEMALRGVHATVFTDQMLEDMNRAAQKTGKKMQEVKAQIKASGNKAEMIENCGMPDEKIYRSVEEIPDDAGYYSLIIVKEK